MQRGGGAQASRKLLAALAVMAVAFVVLAAVPSVAADDTTTPVYGKLTVKFGEGESSVTYQEAGTDKTFDTMKDAMDFVNSFDTTVEANKNYAGLAVTIVCPKDSAINFYSTGSHDLTVKKSVTIEGNGSYAMSNGKYGGHFTVDTFKDYLPAGEETKLVIKNLNNFGVWGQRTTEGAIFTLEMEGCNIGIDGKTLSDGNGKAVYLSEANGVNNITLNNCKFGANANHCTVYSKAPGSVIVENCTFTNISEPININSKAASGEEISVSVKNCIFTDCGLGTVACEEGKSMDGWTTDKSWSAPIRLVNSGGADMSATVENCTFTYTGSNAPANGDILVGEGRDKQVKDGKDVPLTSGPVELDITNTAAQIQWQSTGYYAQTFDNQSAPADAAKQLAIDAQKDAVIGSDGSEITVSKGTATASGTVPAGMTISASEGAKLDASSLVYVLQEVYVDSTIEKDDPLNGKYKTLTAALAAVAENGTIVLKSNLAATGETLRHVDAYNLYNKNSSKGNYEGVGECLPLTKSVTLKSDDGKKYGVGFSIQLAKSGGSFTFDSVAFAPAKGMFAIGAGQGGASSLFVSECDFAITPNDKTSTNQVAAIHVFQCATKVTVENSTFKIVGDGGNGYNTAIMYWGVDNETTEKAVFTGNTVDGYSKFANIDAVDALEITGNTAKNMVGPVTIDGKVKNGSFVQIAIGGASGTSITGEITGNTFTDCAKTFQQVTTHPGSTKTKLSSFETDCSVVFKGGVTIGSDVTIKGDIVLISENGKDAKVTLENGCTLTVAEGKTLTVDQGATLTVDQGATLTGKGKISVSGKLENQGTVTATVTVSEGGSVTGEVPTVYETTRTVYIGNGSEITGTNYGPEQRVEVVGNATIVGDMVVEGLLYVNKDAVLTIEEGGSLTIKGANVSVVEGSLVLLEGANLALGQNAVLNIVGSMSVEGDVTVDRDSNAQIVFKQGADANIGGKISAKKVVIEDSATLTLSGAVAADTVFDVAGTLNIDSRDAVSGSFKINLDKGTVDIANVVLGVTGKDAEITGQEDNSGKATITVTDKGTVIYDKKDKDVTADVTQPSAKNNKVTIAGEVTTSFDKKDDSTEDTEETSYDAGARVSGVKVVSELKVTKIVYKDDNKGTKTAYDGTVYDKAYNDYYEHAYTMTVSGAMSQAGEVFYEGTDATIDVASSIATISVDGKTSAKIGETSVGNWMSLTASDNVAVSGALSLAPRTNTTATDGEKSNAASATFDGKTSVEAAVTVGAGASITFDGETSVKASIDATAAVSSVKAQAVLGTNGKIVVSENGSIAVAKEITADTSVTVSSDNLSAAVYTVGTTNPVTYYVDVDAAIAAMAAGTTDRVSVYGTQTVDASASILANDTLTLETGSVLVVGSEDDGEDVVLTLEKDSALKTKAPAEAQVVVNGTLHAVNKKNVQSTLLGEGVISSEVYSCETDDKGAPVSSGWAEWTNLNNALKNAEAGETIQVMKNADIEGTIKEGVTVKSGENVLTVKQKKTLNVAGVLDITGGTLFIEQASKNEETNAIETAAGAVVLTGRIVLGDFDFTENDEPTNVVMGDAVGSAEFYVIAGAYYRIDGAMEISTPAYAAGKIASVEEQTVAIISVVDARDNAIKETKVGTVDLGEIAFTGKSADEPATVGVFANLTAAGITLENASIVIIGDEEDDVTFDATFKGAESSVAVVGKTTGAFAVSEGAFGESVEHALMVSGKIGDIDFTKKSDSSMKIEGTVYAIPGSDIAVDSVAVSGTLVIAKKDAAATDAAEVKIVALAVSGTLEVKDGAKLTVSGTMKIAGDASVKDGSEISVETLEVSGALVIVEGKVVVNDMATVSGTIDAAALNEEKSNYVASFSAAKLYIGTDSKTVGAAASVTGNVSAGTYAVVAAGATAPAVFTGEDAFLASDKYVSTAFTVDDAAYMTIYTKKGDVAIGDFKAEKDETLFAGWYYKDSKGVEKAVGDGTYVGAVTEVYAKFIDGIYKISIEADGGVAYVTVDGKLMSKEDGKFVFKGLAAGTHKIEISAAAGYDVSKTALYNSDGTAVGSMSIVLSDGKDADLGSDGTVVYNVVSYQLIGSTVAVEPTPEPTPIIIKDDKDDMSLTDILLIVLVVLIVIMAAIVALRMMRS